VMMMFIGTYFATPHGLVRLEEREEAEGSS